LHSNRHAEEARNLITEPERLRKCSADAGYPASAAVEGTATIDEDQVIIPGDWLSATLRTGVSTRVRPVTLNQILDVPAESLAAVIGSWREPALLESGPQFGDSGRFSILTACPRLVWQATGSSWSSRTDRGVSESGEGDVLAKLETLLDRWGLAQPREQPDEWLPPFQGGMIGFFGYDLAPRLERLPRRHARDSRLPDIRMALYDTAVIVDNRSGTTELWSWDLTGEGRRAALKRSRAWRESIERALDSPRAPRLRRSSLARLTSSFDRGTYLAGVNRVLDYIAAGDVFQVNLSQRFTAWGRPEPLDLYLRLKAASPAPFAAFLRWDDNAVVSASPEWFYQTRGDHLVTRPIKGTRPRGGEAEEDARLAAELRNSPKDRAELTMIVDLERNDLGRVCEYGSVAVKSPMKVESFAQVHHLVATVEGKIRSGAGPVDVVRAVFPGGSITGAPKIRAMEIIDELELNRRSLYTGAIGYFSRGGASAFNIAIRTILVEGDRASFQVGGGIVADSEPDAEFEETIVKGRGMRAVLESGNDERGM
jgi:para-aminobenzoate synthetase component 1